MACGMLILEYYAFTYNEPSLEDSVP